VVQKGLQEEENPLHKKLFAFFGENGTILRLTHTFFKKKEARSKSGTYSFPNHTCENHRARKVTTEATVD